VLSSHFAGAARRRSSGQSAGAASRRTTRAEDRHLRTVVRRYQGCLTSLDGRSQRLLALRTGLHGAPRSAGSVAGIMHISVGREQLLEQMSLLTLQSAGNGGCAGASTSAGSAPAGAQLTSSGPWTTTAGTGSPATGAAVPSSTSSEPRSGGDRSVAPPAVLSRAANTSTAEQATTNGDSLSAVVLVLFAALLIAMSLVLLPGVRRRLLPVIAGIPADHPYWGRVGTTRAVATPAPPTNPAPAAPVAAAPPVAASAASIPAAVPAPKPQPAPEPYGLRGQPQAQPEPDRARALAAQDPTPNGGRVEWLREHATQGALLATVVAGGLARVLKGGRGR
jgi:hypothetical protein